MNIGKNIQEVRKKKGLSQRKLAKKAGLYYAIICKLEQNWSKEPTIQTIVKIADALDMSIDELIGRNRK